MFQTHCLPPPRQPRWASFSPIPLLLSLTLTLIPGVSFAKDYVTLFAHTPSGTESLKIEEQKVARLDLPKGLTGLEWDSGSLPDQVYLVSKVHRSNPATNTQSPWAESAWQDWAQSQPDAPAPIDALALMMVDATLDWALSYRIKAGGDWSPWSSQGEIVGFPGGGDPIQALQLRLENQSLGTDMILLELEEAAGGKAAQAAPVPAFSDESAALQAIQKAPSAQNLAKLARLRYGHALQLLKIAEEQEDQDALELAMRYAQASVETDPYEAAYWQLIGMIHARFPQDDQQIAAALALEQALELEPDNNTSQLLLAEVSLRLGLSADSVRLFSDVLWREPNRLTPALLGLLGTACVEAEQVDSCLRMLSYLEQAGEHPSAVRISQALLRQSQGDLEGARRHLKQAARGADNAQQAFIAFMLKEMAWQSGDSQ